MATQAQRQASLETRLANIEATIAKLEQTGETSLTSPVTSSNYMELEALYSGRTRIINELNALILRKNDIDPLFGYSVGGSITGV